jgi:hypothetical protein
MRTSKLLLSGAIVASFLLGPAAVATATTDVIPGGSADRVSGQLVDPVHAYGPDPAPGLPGIMVDKWRYDVAWEGDLALPSHLTLVMHEDVHFMVGPERHAVVCWGEIALEDEDGYMVGPVRGFAVDGAAELHAMLSGGGAYEGANMILTGPIGGEGGGPIEGIVFEGFMPQD